MSDSASDAEFVFTFPENETLKNWESIQDYARKSSIEIEWDVDRQILCVKGVSIEPHKIIDDIGSLIFEANDVSDELYWDQGWCCSIQIDSQVLRLFIVGEQEDPLPTIRQFKANATAHLKENLQRWMHSITSQTYPVYSEHFCDGSPSSREEYFQTLRVTDFISFDPEANEYELYATVAPLISTHLIHLVEIVGVHFGVDLERA